MPPALGSALLVERKAVDDPEFQLDVLEAVYLIALQVNKNAFYAKKGVDLVHLKCTCKAAN